MVLSYIIFELVTRVSLIRLFRQTDTESHHAISRFCSNRSLMTIDDFFCNGQTNTLPSGFGRSGTVAAIKSVKHPLSVRKLFFGSIFHNQYRTMLCFSKTPYDLAPVIDIFRSIFGKNGYQLCNLFTLHANRNPLFQVQL